MNVREKVCSGGLHTSFKMSMRRGNEMPNMSGKHTTASAMRLRADIDQARIMQQAEEAAITTAATAATASIAATEEPVLNFDQLTETEKSAATIGVSPEDLKPIGFMNRAHYTTLLENNAIAGRLTQQIEAFKQVQSAH